MYEYIRFNVKIQKVNFDIKYFDTHINIAFKPLLHIVSDKVEFEV